MKPKKKEDRARSAKSYFKPAAALIFIFAAQSFWHAKEKSATYDEGAHLTISYLISKTDHSDYDIGHPPLVRYLFAVPLLALNPALPIEMEKPVVLPSVPLAERPRGSLYFYSTYFIYANRVPADKMILAARAVNILLGCLLGFWVYLWSRKLYGEISGIFSLALFAFCPHLIAHGSLITTDIGGITFAVGFLYSLTNLTEKSSFKAVCFSGALMGLALLSKFTNLFLVPFFLLFYPLNAGLQNQDRMKTVKRATAVLLIAWCVLCAGYKFQGVFTAHSLQPEDWKDLGYGKTVQSIYRFVPLPDSFLRGICFAVHHDKRGHGSYLLGNYSSAGWWNYFPVAFLVKTPTLTLILLLAALWLQIKRRIALSGTETLILLPILFLVGTSMTAQVNIGLRHILLCYPLLYVFLGKTAPSLLPQAEVSPSIPGRQGWKKFALAGTAFLFHLIEIFSVSPHYLAFFNRPAGGPEKGIGLLSDSNIDWGQDLKGLAEFLKKEGDPELLLAYFGTAVPQYYGIRYQALPTVWSFPKSEHLNSVAPEKEYCAVSVTNLQGTYFSKHDLYGWLKNKKPIKKIGYSIYAYDVTNDLESQEKFLEIYQMAGDQEKILRQAERIKRIRGRMAMGNPASGGL